MRRWVAAPGTCVIGRGSRLAPQQANEPTDAVAHVESSKAVSSAPPSAAHLEGIEEQSQFVTKVRELSTKVHQRCHCHNVSPAPGKVALSNRCHALRAQLRLLSHQSGAGRGGYADANGL